MSETPKIIVGTFMRPDGTPAAGATLTLLLSQDATVLCRADRSLPGRCNFRCQWLNSFICCITSPEVDTHLWCNDQFFRLTRITLSAFMTTCSVKSISNAWSSQVTAR